jgi:DNA-binding transcriptional LysR family regulator
MNWDDLRFVLALSNAGTLARAARALKVDHTTVGRRIEALEENLGVKLFTRTATGYVRTAEADALLPDMKRVEDAVLALERNAHARDDIVTGSVRVTAGETFGACYLAPRLAHFGREHSGLTVELVMGGDVLDLARREADIAVRLFRSQHADLVIKRAGELAHGLYAAKTYLAKHPVKNALTLADHPLLTASPGPNIVEALWLEQLSGGAQPAFVSNLTMALVAAVREGAGIAVLPRYIGDADNTLKHIKIQAEPRETIWVTVHRDMKQAPRVRLVLDFIHACLKRDQKLLLGS